MKYAPIDPQLFVENRRRLAALLPPKSLAILNANDVPETNADGTRRFRQNSDLFYLSGVDQEDTILMLFPDAPEEKHREILFLRETNEEIAVWEGAKLTKEQARAATGVQTVLWLDEFPKLLRSLVFLTERVFLNANEHSRAGAVVQSRDARFVEQMRQSFPLHRYERLAPLLYSLRQIKQLVELELIKRACEITGQGFRRLLGFVKPGVTEYEVEAELAHEFLRRRAQRFAYVPIIASGANACVLHYLANDQVCQDGDLLLLDVAAEYANFNSDLTRTIPVNGRFTARQRAVYEAVLRVLRGAIGMLKPGVIIKEYQDEVGKLMEAELLGLGLLKPEEVAGQDPDKPAFKKYFPHGTSHHLGLDVHDVGNTWRPLEPGMVLTVEPGIYIREEKLGVRLENDVLITEEGNVDLMADIPIEADDIEALMSAS